MKRLSVNLLTALVFLPLFLNAQEGKETRIGSQGSIETQLDGGFNQPKNAHGSKWLIAAALLCFLLGGGAWFLFAMAIPGYERLAVPVAALLAAVGGLILIFNAVIHPESIQRPNIHPPKIEIHHRHIVPPNVNVPEIEIEIRHRHNVI